MTDWDTQRNTLFPFLSIRNSPYMLFGPFLFLFFSLFYFLFFIFLRFNCMKEKYETKKKFKLEPSRCYRKLALPLLQEAHLPLHGRTALPLEGIWFDQYLCQKSCRSHNWYCTTWRAQIIIEAHTLYVLVMRVGFSREKFEFWKNA